MSLNIFSMATDKDVASKGVEKDWNGAKVRVARANNPEYMKYLSNEFDKCRAAIEAQNKHADEVASEIYKEAFIRFVLVGWSGFVDDEGKEFKYNLKNAREVYDRVPDLVRDVTVISAEDANYRVKTLKADADSLKK